MTVILKGSEQLERLMPLLTKAINGAEKHGEIKLAHLIQYWKDQAIQYLRNPDEITVTHTAPQPSRPQPIPEPQVTPEPIHSNGAVSADPDSIDPELDLMVKTLSNLISHLTPEELLAEAAKQLQLGRTPADVEHDFLRDDGE